MEILSRDTNPEIEKIWITMLKTLTPSQRFLKVQSLTKTVINMSRRAIKKANPNSSEEEIDLLFVKYHYGEDLAEKLKKYLKKIKNEQS